MAQNVIEVVTRARDELSAGLKTQAQEVRNFQSALGNAALAAAPFIAALTAIGTAAYQGFKSLADETERLKNLSTVTGASTRDLALVRQALTEQGIAADESSQALVFLNRQIAEGNPLLKALGITTRDSYTALLQLGDAFAQSSDTATKAGIAQALLGRGSRELIAALPTLRKSVDDVAGSMASMGAEAFVAGEAVGSMADAMADRFSRRLKDVQRSATTMLGELLIGMAAITGNATLISGGLAGGGGRASHAGKMHPQTPQDDALRQVRAMLEAQEKAANGAERQARALSDAAKNLGIVLYDSVKGLEVGGVSVTADRENLFGKGRGDWDAKSIIEDFKRVQQQGMETANWLGSYFGAINLSMLASSQAFAQGVRGIFKSMADATIGEIARMAAIKFISFLINSVIPGGGAAVSGGAGGVLKNVGGSSLKPAGATGAGNTFIIQTYDARSTLEQLVSPAGSLRQANDRVGVLGLVP